MNFRTAALAISMLALSTLLATSAAAQTGGGASNASAGPGATAKPVAPDAIPPGADDMRLWSFGECDRRFPYVSSDEHKQCVRVVGSEDARDARAYRVCDVSHERDREEAARCKAAYKANKQKAAQDGYVPNTAAQPLAAPSPDVMQKVRAIAEAAVEHDREAASTEAAAAPAAASAAAAEPELERGTAETHEFWSPMTLIGTLSLCMLILAVTATIGRRKLTGLIGGE
jgi:hypothetical protein